LPISTSSAGDHLRRRLFAEKVRPNGGDLVGEFISAREQNTSCGFQACHAQRSLTGSKHLTRFASPCAIALLAKSEQEAHSEFRQGSRESRFGS
jgi:hypothetical protein